MLNKHLKELRRLYGKFREGTLTMEEVLGGYVLCFVIGPFFVVPIYALGFIDTEAVAANSLITDDERVFYVTVFFFILFFIINIILFSRSLPQKPSLLIRIYRLLGAAIFAVFFSYICGIGYFIFWNAVSGNGKKTLVSGPIVHMEIQRSTLYTGKPYYITLRYENRDVKLTVPPEEYAQLSPGQTYYREMHLGGLGYYYNWGSKWWK